jgi:hypothetical protein
MADHDERLDDWGHDVAKWTFVWSIVLTVLFVGSVFVFILR